MKSPSVPAPRTPAEDAGRAYYQARGYRAEAGVLSLLRRAQLAIGQLVSEETALGGSTLPQWVPLYKVYLGHADTVAGLARACRVDAGAMTRQLDRLERKGLCRRVRSDSDRRVVRIELTTEGVAEARRMPQVLSRVYNRVLADFDPAEWQQLQTLLARLAEHAEALAGPGKAGEP
ncbi:MAG TPA: MarR family winged helix-turn-helix transcriptional regulator [Ottowia sp.]|uniref:MarR family winged helix-turn-helix transcriptional regulator n=1 Tax=Ottowia sp. TaxID=1898956 RepID=UPI002CEAB8CF|nr:MarR family winged helix-turn-helix transcriptional regulator [Ottowia sp.]HMN20789.1 MarR family winged helix-turn-helix transcriptional regulator [Ottowia sp.]